MNEKYLTQLKANETATVKEIQGGCGISGRLESLGVRPGKRITKISSHFWGGPVTVIVGKTKIAIGHGMAKRIVVET